MNALAHCVEVVYSPHRTPEAEAIALAGARRIFNALPLVVDDPDDVDVRASMLEGAALAGRCLQNGTMGVHHGLAQLVGGRTGIPHGLANAVILPHAMRFNADGGARRGPPARRGDRRARRSGRRDRRAGRPARPADAARRTAASTLEDLDAVARLSQGNRNVRVNPRPSPRTTPAPSSPLRTSRRFCGPRLSLTT